jgi:hypothetical protein
MATGRWHGVWWPPNPGWCRKLGAIRSFLLSRSTYDGLGEENATGAKWAPTRASTVPPERRGGGRDPGRPPSASRARPHHASSRTKPQTTASLSLNFVSRPKFRVPLEIPTRVRSSYFDPAHYYFLFSYGGRRGGDGEQQYNLFWHDVDIFPPKMTKK